MIYILFNAPQILAATAAGLLVGALYHWLSAGRLFQVATPVSGRAGTLILVAVLAQGWLAAILAGALILAPDKAGAWTMAIGSAVVIWIGFVLPTLLVTGVYRRAATAETLLDAVHWLAVMVAQAAVLEGLGVALPAQ